jgi:large subunit ribosomal protein L25
MPEKITFSAQPRTLMGKKSGQLRRQGQVPANINGNVEQTVAITVDKAAFNKLYHKVGDTGLFYLKVEGESKDRPVLVSDLQLDPLSAQVEHVVFRQVDLSEKVKAEVAVELIGELQVRNALIVTLHNTVEVEALPQDLPEKFVVDISKFENVNDMITFEDLDFDRSKVSLQIAEEQTKEPIVMVQEVKEQLEPETPVTVVGDVAATAEGGEAPAAEAPKAEEKAAA